MGEHTYFSFFSPQTPLPPLNDWVFFCSVRHLGVYRNTGGGGPSIPLSTFALVGGDAPVLPPTWLLLLVACSRSCSQTNRDLFFSFSSISHPKLC